MLDLAEELHRWIEEGREFAVATVLAVGGSAPRGPGAALAVDNAGTVIGSVSGGCVEGAVYDLCQQALRTGQSVVERFGYSDEDAFAVGLTCGGTIEVLITPVAAAAATVLASALSAAVRDEPAALVRVARGPAELLGRALLVRPDGTHEGGLGGHQDLDRTAAAEARALLEAGRTKAVEVSADGSHCPGGLTLLVESNVPPPRMIVFGAVDFAAALARAGKFLGYHVTVCDARPVFATKDRFPDADEVVVDWPHRYLRRTGTDARTVLAVLTHDAKFDVPLLKAALRMPAAFIGAMGSAPYPRGPRPPAAGGRSDRGGTGPAAFADRARPRRPHTGGDRPVDRGGDRRRPAGRHGRPADRVRHADPSGQRTTRGVGGRLKG
ncbi:hypothetical protein GCM10010339_56680 [Streptomyces alanosinicus]|uniref:XdhC/CoxI family protein n=1 Tax=Streptomyces alanosinicus TaxID=68171 RepID=A0A919D6A8_9ACTN|nr:hypothetical protein GCM10010339_56680 [Streptomyces alanosinicus]